MKKSESPMDKLTRAMREVSIIAQAAQEEAAAAESERARQHFVLIDFQDVRENGPATGRCVNEYMLRRGFFDPRRASCFLDDVLDEGQSPATHPIGDLCEIARVSRSYYGFWCVRPDFSVPDFYAWLAQHIAWPITVNICLIIDNEFDRYIRTFK